MPNITTKTDENIRVIIKEAVGTSLGTGGRGDSVPNFWLPGCSSYVMQPHEDHVFEVDGEGGPVLLNAGSVWTYGISFSAYLQLLEIGLDALGDDLR